MKRNPENLTPSWMNREGDPSPYTAAAVFPHLGGDPENIILWEKFFEMFSGKILEVGAGTGFLAKNILQKNKNVDYTILDIDDSLDTILKYPCPYFCENPEP